MTSLFPNALKDAGAEEYFHRALKEARDSGSLDWRYEPEIAYGRWLMQLGRLDDAAEVILSALRVAECWLQKESTDSPYLHSRNEGVLAATSAVCHACHEYAAVRFQLHHYDKAVEFSRLAQISLAKLLAFRRSPSGIRRELQSESYIFELGLKASLEHLVSRKLAAPTETNCGTEFIDGNKAVWVREALHRLVTATATFEVKKWAAVLPDGALRCVSSRRNLRSASSRGVGRSKVTKRPVVCVLELSNTPSSVEEPIVGPLLGKELADWRPPTSGDTDESTTVYIQFDFVGYDLYVIPLRRGRDGRLEEVRTHAGGYKILYGKWTAVDELTKRWHAALDEVFEGPHAGDSNEGTTGEPSLINSPATRFRERIKHFTKPGNADAKTRKRLAPLVGEWPSVCEPNEATRRPPAKLMRELGAELELEKILELIEPRSVKWKDLHLVLLPDVQLYQLPIYAAWINWTERSLMDTVGSVRYALSLRVQKTLEEIERLQASNWPNGVPLHGSLFANPTDTWFDGSDNISFEGGYLHGASDEVANIVSSDETLWRVYGDLIDEDKDDNRLATCSNLKIAAIASTVLWVSSHGRPDYPDQINDIKLNSPGLLMCDGPLTAARVVADEYDFGPLWLFHASSCLFSRLESEDADRQAEGFIAALMVRGCRRVSGPMWELADTAAVSFAKHYVGALRKNVFEHPSHGPNAFAVALKEAIRALREEDNGRFDHEIFWAPFVLYGLG